MLAKFKNLLARPSTTKPPAIPFGERVYAIGDIHGRIDLFNDLIRLIEDDDRERGKARTTIVLLGDLIDRGQDSAAVVARARTWSRERDIEFIQGNHEEMLLASRRKTEAMRGFLKFGGQETIRSYGISAEVIASAEVEELQQLMNEAIPQEDFDFLESFRKMVRIGDYLFVHAGIRPDTPLDHQLGSDCRWIREPFLTHKGHFGAFVIHGHTITEEPEVCHNRIGIDTGAYLLGRLTAIGLQGTERWFLQAHQNEALHKQEATAAA